MSNSILDYLNLFDNFSKVDISIIYDRNKNRRLINIDGHFPLITIDLTNKIAFYTDFKRNTKEINITDEEVIKIKEIISDSLLLPGKCNCECHLPGSMMMHVHACC